MRCDSVAVQEGQLWVRKDFNREIVRVIKVKKDETRTPKVTLRCLDYAGELKYRLSYQHLIDNFEAVKKKKKQIDARRPVIFPSYGRKPAKSRYEAFQNHNGRAKLPVRRIALYLLALYVRAEADSLCRTWDTKMHRSILTPWMGTREDTIRAGHLDPKNSVEKEVPGLGNVLIRSVPTRSTETEAAAAGSCSDLSKRRYRITSVHHDGRIKTLEISVVTAEKMYIIMEMINEAERASVL